MSRLIDDFKNKISSYDKEYRFSQEEVLNILERYEIKYENVKAIPLDKIRQAIEEIKVEAGVEHIDGADCDDILVVELRDVLEILDKLIAESKVEG